MSSERAPPEGCYLILGAGGVTAAYYVPALDRLGVLDQAVVVDASGANLNELAQVFPQLRRIKASYADVITAAETHGTAPGAKVIVALPNHLHVDATEMALRKGFDVLCEKPLSLRGADCARLRTVAASEGRTLKVAMSRRYLPSLMLAKQIVRAKELGAVQSVEVRDCAQFQWRPKSFGFFAPEAGGVLADMGVHYLDYLDTVLGPLEPVAYADDACGGNEASLSYELRAASVPVKMQLSRIHGGGAFLRLVCDRGEILIEKTGECEILVTPVGGATRRVSWDKPFSDPSWPTDFRGSFCQMLHDFGRAGSGRSSEIASAADAERTAALIEWAYNHRDAASGMDTVKARGAARQADILVTGGTGFIGGHLIDRLSADGNAIRATVRSPESCANIARYPLEIAPVNLLDVAEVERAVAGMRHVFHLAYGRGGRDAPAITIQGTKNIVEAAIKAGVECVVVLSTMYVFGFPETSSVVDESFPYRPYGGEYGESKAKMERWCLKRAQTSGATRIVVLNPTCVFGPGGGTYTTLPVSLARNGEFCWIEEGRGLCNFTYVKNVVDAALAASSVAEAHGQRFIINDGTMTWRQFLEPLISRISDTIPNYSRAEFVILPRRGPRFRFRDLFSAAYSSREIRDVVKRSTLMRPVLASARAMAGSSTMARPNAASSARTVNPVSVPPDWIASLYGPATSIFSSRKATEVLGWVPSTAYEEARDQTIRWLENAGHLPPAAG
jgi:nucleoside-diphosphate-sugar epimerase/predicted dehydrogenase